MIFMKIKFNNHNKGKKLTLLLFAFIFINLIYTGTACAATNNTTFNNSTSQITLQTSNQTINNTISNMNKSNNINTSSNINNQNKANFSSIQGYYINPSDTAASSINPAILKSQGVTDVFILTNRQDPNGTLEPFITKFAGTGINVYSWVESLTDFNGNYFNPEVNITLENQIIDDINSIAANYNVNGVMLDYLEFPGNAYEYPNATADIDNFVAAIRNNINTINNMNTPGKPHILLSADLSPEGSVTDYYYGDSYSLLSNYLDFLSPMIYLASFNENTSWIGTTMQYIIGQATKPVVAVLQTYDWNVNPLTVSALDQDIGTALSNGSYGYELFRYGLLPSNWIGYNLSTLTIYNTGIPVSRGGNPAGYDYPSITSAISVAEPGDTLMLEDGGAFYESGLTLNENLTFNVFNSGTATINGNNTQTIFSIDPGVSVILMNIILENGAAATGGAINNEGNLTIKNCILQNNTASYGGAIFNTGTLTDNNNAYNNNSASSISGAICNTGTANITNSNFTGNTVTGNNGIAGAVGSDGTLTITNSIFNGNMVSGIGGLGGALANYGSATDTNDTLTGNSAMEGGAIYIYSTGTSTDTNNTYISNTASYGGAIFNENKSTITNSTFNNNSASSISGAICNTGTANITNSNFTGNTVTGNNGIAGAVGSDGTLTMNCCNFSGNMVVGSGGLGGALANYGSANDTNTTFTGNTASYGGAIFNENKSTITNSTFNNNSASSISGAICNTGNAYIIHTNFTGNTVTGNNGIAGAVGSDGTLTINNSTFTGNMVNGSNGEGGALANYGPLTLTNSTFTGNTATEGGAVYNDNSGSSTIQYNRLIGNTKYDIYSIGGSVNATDNWWGTNFTGSNPLTVGRVTSNVNTISWIVLTLTANPTNIPVNGNSIITADLLHDNIGATVTGIVPYTGLVTFTTTLGNH